MYPVDLPAVDDTELNSAAQQYLSTLAATPCSNEWFQCSQTSKVEITARNISQLQLFEDEQPTCVVLALHPPDDQTKVVALYLHGKWWHLDDVLRTSSKSRSGLVSVQTMMERVIVFLLSQVVERPSSGEVLFSLHPRTESCKVLWMDNQAVGFYSVKHKGSLCDGWTSCSYLLPVLDTVLVRRSCRRRGFSLQILVDFCSSFSSEEFLGISSPLSPSMAAVVRSFLQQHEEHRERLYEVEAPGGWTQRRNIWLNIRLDRYHLGIKEGSSPTSGQTQQNKGSISFQQTCEMDHISLSSCNMNTLLLRASAEQQIKPGDMNHGKISLSSKISGTRCNPAVNADVLDCEPLTRSQITVQALKSKDTLSGKHSSDEPEEMQKSAKRSRMTVNL
ncbi:protein FAM169B isoform X2 [Melanotaenia boesemani]|nr:protein FAM169B isoform X2 [Melanotaenia boesemani]